MHPFGKNHGKWSSSFGVLADTNFGSSWRMGLPSYCTKSLHKKMTARNHDLSKLTKLDLVAALPHWLSGKAKSAGVLQLGFWPLAPILFSFNHLHAVSASWHCLLNRSQRQRLRRTAEVDHRGSWTDFVWKNMGFRASAISQKRMSCETSFKTSLATHPAEPLAIPFALRERS